MASEAVVKRTLQSIANMFNKGSWWVSDSTKMWMLQLHDIDDRDLIIGTKNCLRKAKKLPTVANLIDIIKADPRSAARQPTEIAACPACYGSGCREMSRWWTDKGAQRVSFGLAACDCPKGIRLSGGAFQDWRSVRDAWQRDRWTDAVYYGTAAQPHLTTEQTITPDELQARADRAKANRDKSPSLGSWHNVGTGAPVQPTE